MIGSGLKKLAKEQGMSVAQGVAFGTLRGYAATLSEGMGFKTVAVTTRLEEEKKVLKAPQSLWVDLNDVLLSELKHQLGENSVKVKYT